MTVELKYHRINTEPRPMPQERRAINGWTVRLLAETHTQEGKRRTINRVLSRKGFSSKVDMLVAVAKAVNSKPNPGLWHGVGLWVETPLHRTCYVIDPDTREISCVS